jgi:predicted nucleic acid-binding protein
VILLDSSLIIAYSNESDENHADALNIIDDVVKEKYGPPVITDYIFDEVTTVMLVKTKNVNRVARFGEYLLAATSLVKVDESLFNLAWDVFKQQRKPAFSFTDCTTIATCRRNGISNIGTFDEAFAKLSEFKMVAQ